MEPEITEAAKGFNGKRALAKKTAQLHPTDVPFFIGFIPGAMAGFDTFFLSTYSLSIFSFSKIAHLFPYDTIAGVDELADRTIDIRLKNGSHLAIKKLAREEHHALRAALDVFPVRGANAEAWAAWNKRRRELAAAYVPTQKEMVKSARAAEAATRRESADAEREHQHALRERAATKAWPNTRTPNGPPNKAGGLTILQHSHPGEEPWFILTSIGAGCMACFEDRLMIIKAGNMQGWMAGTMFGGRSTTFYYRDINAIEFNKQVFGSVLEVLTASYQGTNNHDYWKGATQSRNADSGDPYTLSNTLPIGNSEYARARAELSELRQRISVAKQVQVNVAPQQFQPPQPVALATAHRNDDLVSKLSKLAELRDTGVLTEEEFAAAKARLLAEL